MRGGSDEHEDPSHCGVEGLTRMCARHLEAEGNSGHASASAEELSALILGILRGPALDTQNVLLDLLGYDALDLIGWIVEHSQALLRSSAPAEPVSAEASGASQQEDTPVPPAIPASSLGLPQKRDWGRKERRVDMEWREDPGKMFKEAVILPPRRCAKVVQSFSAVVLGALALGLYPAARVSCVRSHY